MRAGCVLVVLLLAASARADNGVYLDVRFGIGSSRLDRSEPETEKWLEANQVRAALGLRRGSWALEPSLMLRRAERLYPELVDRQFGAYGVDVRYVSSPARIAQFWRAGVHRTLGQVERQEHAVIEDASRKGFGIAVGTGGLMMSRETGSPLVGACYVELGLEMLWFPGNESGRERLTSLVVSLGGAIGSGY